MTEIPGRNDPCWCGSGKKYKKCHYLTDSQPKSIEEAPFWIQMRVADGDLQEEIRDFYRARWKRELFPWAQKDFYFQDPKAVPERIELDHLISYWALAPYAPGKGLDSEVSLAAAYLEAEGANLPDLKKRVLLALDERPFSFYQVRNVEPGVSMRLKDLLLGDEWTVMDRLGSNPAMVGRIIYARVVSLDNSAIMMGSSPYPFEPLLISDIQRLRTFLKPKGELKVNDLHEHKDTIVDVYLQLRNLHLNPPPPRMVNTDGDPLEMVALHWSLEGALESAVDALLSLTLDTKPEALTTAKTDKVGRLKWVELIWAKRGNKQNRHWTNTTLGRLVLEPGKVKAEVNSQKRATKLRKEFEKRLGKTAVFEKAVIESLESKLKAHKKSPPKPAPSKDTEEEAAIEDALVALQKKHWDGWINEAIPALGGLTPKQAVRTKEGLERVEALLFSYEDGNKRANRASMVPVDELRKRLKL